MVLKYREIRRAQLARAIILLGWPLLYLTLSNAALAQQPGDAALSSPPATDTQHRIVCEHAAPPRGSHWVCDKADRPCDCHLESNSPGQLIFGDGERQPTPTPEQDSKGSEANCTQFAVEDFVAPAYPYMARLARIQGQVRIHVRLGSAGKVTTIAAEGHPLLMKYAKENLQQWTFRKLSNSEELTVIFDFKLHLPETFEYRPSTVVAHFPCEVDISTNQPKAIEDGSPLGPRKGKRPTKTP